MHPSVASVSKRAPGESNQCGADLAQDVAGIVEHVLTEETQDGEPEPLEMVLTPGVCTTARLIRMPSPTVDFDDETDLFEDDIGSRRERSIGDLDLRRPTSESRPSE